MTTPSDAGRAGEREVVTCRDQHPRWTQVACSEPWPHFDDHRDDTGEYAWVNLTAQCQAHGCERVGGIKSERFGLRLCSGHAVHGPDAEILTTTPTDPEATL